MGRGLCAAGGAGVVAVPPPQLERKARATTGIIRNASDEMGPILGASHETFLNTPA
jgi:hypothetical protein